MSEKEMLAEWWWARNGGGIKIWGEKGVRIPLTSLVLSENWIAIQESVVVAVVVVVAAVVTIKIEMITFMILLCFRCFQ